MKYFDNKKVYALNGFVLNNLLEYGRIVGNRHLTSDEARDLQNYLYQVIPDDAIELDI